MPSTVHVTRNWEDRKDPVSAKRVSFQCVWGMGHYPPCLRVLPFLATLYFNSSSSTCDRTYLHHDCGLSFSFCIRAVIPASVKWLASGQTAEIQIPRGEFVCLSFVRGLHKFFHKSGANLQFRHQEVSVKKVPYWGSPIIRRERT